MRRLALFARRPIEGRVKTRLSPALPPGPARALYSGLLEDALAAVRASRRAEQRFVYWADSDSPEGDASIGGLVARVQRGADLGERLAAAFDELLVERNDRAIVIGADAPELDAAVIDAAFGRLEASPGVIVPATDGGYALIGLARRAPELFRDVPWSGPRTLSATLERARAIGLGVDSLPEIADVDTPADVAALVARAVTGALRPDSRTRAALESLGLMMVP